MSKRYPGGFLTGDEPTVNQQEADGIWTLDQQAVYKGQNEWPLNRLLAERSLRFNSADSTYLNWTPAQAGNRRIWTWSSWVKRSYPDGISNSQNRMLFSAQSGTPWFQMGFEFFDSGVGNIDITFSAGVSALYHQFRRGAGAGRRAEGDDAGGRDLSGVAL